MKLLFVNDKFPPDQTTVGTLLYRQIEVLKKRDDIKLFVFTCLTDKEAGTKYTKIKYYQAEGVSFYKIPKMHHSGFLRSYLNLYNPFVNRSFKKVIKEIQPDVIHFHNVHEFLCFSLYKLAKKYSQAVFLTTHDVMLVNYGKLFEFIDSSKTSSSEQFNYRISSWQQFKRYKKRYVPFRKFYIKRCLKYIDKIFSVSLELKKVLNQNGIKNIDVLRNAINPLEWEVSNNELQRFKKKLGLLDSKVIMFGGRLSSAKGGEQILKAFKLVSKSIPEVKLLVMGSQNEYTKRMIQVAEKYGFKNSLVFTGWISGLDKKLAFNSADVLVSPSVCFDSFPTVNLEAMACKKPVITSCFGGAKEIVIDNSTGYVINPFNTDDFSNKIIDLLEHPQKAIVFGDAGYDRLVKYFMPDDQINKLLSYYNKFISDRKNLGRG